MMRKTVGVFSTVALIMAAVGTWAKLASVAGEPVVAATVAPSGAAISPLELMFQTGGLLDLPKGHDYTLVYPDE
jgi:hypothetical protein